MFDIDLTDALELHVTEFRPSSLASLDDLPEKVHRYYFAIRSGQKDRAYAEQLIAQKRDERWLAKNEPGHSKRFTDLFTRLRGKPEASGRFAQE